MNTLIVAVFATLAVASASPSWGHGLLGAPGLLAGGALVGPLGHGAAVIGPVAPGAAIVGPVNPGAAVIGPVHGPSAVVGPVQGPSAIVGPVNAGAAIAGPINGGAAIIPPISHGAVIAPAVSHGAVIAGGHLVTDGLPYGAYGDTYSRLVNAYKQAQRELGNDNKLTLLWVPGHDIRIGALGEKIK